MINYFSPEEICVAMKSGLNNKTIFLLLCFTANALPPPLLFYLKPNLHICLIQLSEEMEKFQFMFLLSFGGGGKFIDLLHCSLVRLLSISFCAWERKSSPKIINFLIDQVFDFSFALANKQDKVY